MFSHVVIFWTKPGVANAEQDLQAAIEDYVKPIPGVLHFHCGRMAKSHRSVVDQSYQVALTITFTDKKAQDDYQEHPLHTEFVNGVFKRTCQKVVVYDFE